MKTKLLTLILLLSIVGHNVFADTQRDLVKKNLDQYFQSITVTPSGFTFVRPESGFKLDGFIDNKPIDFVLPGAKVTVPFGKSFALRELHSGIEFAPLPSKMLTSGLLVTKYFDARSFGGEKENYKAIVLFNKDGEPKILPLSGEEAKKILSQTN